MQQENLANNDWRTPGSGISRYRLEASIILALLCLLAWSIWHYAASQHAERPGSVPPAVAAFQTASLATAGQPAPGFVLSTLENREISLAEHLGHPVLLNFWASWCGPCRTEMPMLNRAYQAHNDEGLTILAINLSHQDSLASIRQFVEYYQVKMPVLLDTTGEVSDDLYGARGLPMSVFIDRSGTVRHIYIGAIPQDALDRYMKVILAE
jgi:thiol-disulfide isomerase/thioredoxin